MVNHPESETTSIADGLSRLVQEQQLELPPYPEVILRLQQVLAQDESSAGDVAELIANEPALATQILRIANSAAYGGLHEVSEIGQAVARLGVTQVASLVTALTVKSHFVAEDPQRADLIQELWNHAVATAIAARSLAEKTGASCEQAFLAGLLHDVGKLLVLRGVDALRAEGIEIPETETVLDELMDLLHAKLGHDALRAWNLPEELSRVALGHHDPETDAKDLLMLCVQAADLVSRKAGFHPEPDPELQLLHEPAIEMLGLMDLSIASLIVDLEDEIEEKHRLFGAGRDDSAKGTAARPGPI